MANHTWVAPSLAGRPSAPTFTIPRPSSTKRCQWMPVCVHAITSASCSRSSRWMNGAGVVLDQRNSLILRGEPWHSSTRRPATVRRRWPGRVAIHRVWSDAVCARV